MLSSKLTQILFLILTVLITAAISFWYVRAGALNPTVAPSDTQYTLEDIYCKITGCTPTAYGTDSPAAATSTMRTLQEIYDAAQPNIDYSQQKNIVYDDWNCANNNEEASSTCAAGDAEPTQEEATWASTTDSALAGALVASGKVYRDLRTGLYWADAYDSTSGSGTPDGLDDNFTIGTGCSDAEINNGTCDQANYQTKGQAIQYCLDLSLDATGDGADETDWYLPSQKELMQAINDGAANILPNAAYNYWSSTEYNSIATWAWNVSLDDGRTGSNGKSTGNYVRCGRRSP